MKIIKIKDSIPCHLKRLFHIVMTKTTVLYLVTLYLQLPEKYCNVILLRDIQEVSTREIANILNIYQLHRAKWLLKATLADALIC